MAIGARGSNPIWLLADLQGHLFDDTFYMFVLENTIPYVPADVYRDVSLNTVWNNPIRFLGNGTLPVDIFFEQDKFYRLEFRQGDTQSAPLIYEVNNYSVSGGNSPPVEPDAFATDNQITNPQFSIINVVSPYTVTGTNPASTQVAPGWFLDLGGTGTAVITQVPLNNTNINPSNAPYALRLTLNGWTEGTVVLRQQFQQNGMLWANKTISTAITARVQGAPQGITAALFDSNGSLLTTVLPLTNVVSAWTEYLGHGTTDATTNPNTPPGAFVEYRLSLPSNVDIYLTSIQLIVQNISNISEPAFEQDSINRQIDHTFNYYKDPLLYKPIKSYLVGWDFPLNPAQLPFTGSYSAITPKATGDNGGYYAWDQTIVFQAVDSSISITRSTIPAMQVQATNGTQFALIQYLESSSAMNAVFEAYQTGLSVNVRCESTISQNLTVSLWRTDNASVPTLPATLVTGLDARGKPSGVVAGWVEIPRTGFGNAILTSTGNVTDFGFSGWREPSAGASQSTNFFAIVVGSDAIVAPNVFQMMSISLVPGNVPTIPAPQTRDDVLRECSRYYQKSFATTVSPDSATGVINAAFANSQVQAASTTANGPTVVFPVEMRTTPSVTLYNPITAASNQIVSTANASWNSSVSAQVGTKGFITSGTTPVGSAATQGAFVHWTASAQLGLV